MVDKEEFENLEPQDQVEVFKKSQLSEKWDLLRHAHEPEKLAQLLSHEELYLVTREMDVDERSEIIRYANYPQLLFLSDLECWSKDRINPPGFLKWIETLKDADERRLFVWLVETDYETVVSGLKGLVTVLKPDWEYAADEALGDAPYFTIDQLYYVLVKEEDMDTIKRALELLFEHHRGKYTAYLEGVMGDLDDVVEEEAYRNREARLSDRGFPSPESARQVYKPISETEYEMFPRKEILNTNNGLSGLHLPNYPALWSKEKNFLDEVLMLLQTERPEVTEQIYEELAWLSNKVLACEGIDLSSEEKVVSGIELARSMVSIGLELKSGGDLDAAKKILLERWLEILFRVPVTLLMSLRTRALNVLKVYWYGDISAFFIFLEGAYEKIMQGLLQKFPEQYDDQAKKKEHPFRPFRNLEEIQRTDRALQQIENIHGSILKSHPEWIEMLKDTDNPLVDVSMSSALATLFAASVTSGRLNANPLEAEQIQQFVRAAFEKKGSRNYLKQELKDDFLSELYKEEKTLNLMRPLWGIVFQEIEEEVGGIQDADYDLRFLKCVWAQG